MRTKYSSDDLLTIGIGLWSDWKWYSNCLNLIGHNTPFNLYFCISPPRVDLLQRNQPHLAQHGRPYPPPPSRKIAGSPQTEAHPARQGGRGGNCFWCRTSRCCTFPKKRLSAFRANLASVSNPSAFPAQSDRVISETKFLMKISKVITDIFQHCTTRVLL